MPRLSVTEVVPTAVASSVNVTLAAGITAPLESVTTPLSCAVYVDCPRIPGASITPNTTIASTPNHPSLLIPFIPHPKKNFLGFLPFVSFRFLSSTYACFPFYFLFPPKVKPNPAPPHQFTLGWATLPPFCGTGGGKA